MSICNVEVEVGAWLTESGIETTVYIGRGVDMPAAETHETYEELIDRSLTGYTVMNGELLPEHYAEVSVFLEGLKSAYQYAEKRAKEMGWEVEA